MKRREKNKNCNKNCNRDNSRSLYHELMTSMKNDLPNLERRAQTVDDEKARRVIEDLLEEIRNYQGNK